MRNLEIEADNALKNGSKSPAVASWTKNHAIRVACYRYHKQIQWDSLREIAEAWLSSSEAAPPVTMPITSSVYSIMDHPDILHKRIKEPKLRLENRRILALRTAENLIFKLHEFCNW